MDLFERGVRLVPTKSSSSNSEGKTIVWHLDWHSSKAPQGKTAHSAFKFPVPLLETCLPDETNLQTCWCYQKGRSLIIWDEVSCSVLRFHALPFAMTRRECPIKFISYDMCYKAEERSWISSTHTFFLFLFFPKWQLYNTFLQVKLFANTQKFRYLKILNNSGWVLLPTFVCKETL